MSAGAQPPDSGAPSLGDTVAQRSVRPASTRAGYLCASLALLLAVALPCTASAQDGEVQRGAALYEARCGGCHSLDANRIGPTHQGVFGRRAGSVADYGYSSALRNSRIVWDERTLDAWLRDPQALIPGQKMGYSLQSAAERADIIAWLRQASPP